MDITLPGNVFAPGDKDESESNCAYWRYDGFGRVVETSDPDLGYSGMTYNAFGDVAARTDARGLTTALVYDRLGRLIEKTLPGDEGVMVFAYDGLSGSGNCLGRAVSVVLRPAAPIRRMSEFPTIHCVFRATTTVPRACRRGFPMMPMTASFRT